MFSGFQLAKFLKAMDECKERSDDDILALAKRLFNKNIFDAFDKSLTVGDDAAHVSQIFDYVATGLPTKWGGIAFDNVFYDKLKVSYVRPNYPSSYHFHSNLLHLELLNTYLLSYYYLLT